MSFQQDENARFLSQYDLLCNCIEHTPVEKRGWKGNENSMTPQQQMEHITGSNYFFAAMIKDEHLPEPREGDPQAKSFEEARSDFDESCQMMADTIASVSNSDLEREVILPHGRSVKNKFLMTIPASHIAYHWGQLALTQKMYGDDVDHFFADPNFKFGQRF
jgi:uncharacterized damage-inducible protein DinB